jgi:hypothetical protein
MGAGGGNSSRGQDQTGTDDTGGVDFINAVNRLVSPNTPALPQPTVMGQVAPRSSVPTYDSRDYINTYSKYFYRDPSAAGVPGPGNNLNQRFNPNATSYVKMPDGELTPGESLVNRLNAAAPSPFYNPAAPQEHEDPANVYDKSRYQGMVYKPSADMEVAEGTGIFEMDGKQYILPTQVSGVPLTREETLQRYKDTGEHLGAFETLPDARFYEQNYLQPFQQSQQAILPSHFGM